MGGHTGKPKLPHKRNGAENPTCKQTCKQTNKQRKVAYMDGKSSGRMKSWLNVGSAPWTCLYTTRGFTLLYAGLETCFQHLRCLGPSENTSQIAIVGTILKPLNRAMLCVVVYWHHASVGRSKRNGCRDRQRGAAGGRVTHRWARASVYCTSTNTTNAVLCCWLTAGC